MSEQHVPEFEDRLRTLLTRAAEAMPTDTDMSARVRQAHARGTRMTSGLSGIGPRHGLATVAAVLVVALLAGLLVFAHPGGSLRPAGGVTGKSTATASTGPTQGVVPPPCRSDDPPANPPLPSGTPVDHSVAVGRYASLHGITITIDRAYADATQTVITYHAQTNVNSTMPYIPVLIDAQGHRYGMFSGGWDIKHGGTLIFAPLPTEELGTPQQLTFFTQQMQPVGSTALSTLVDGPWQISFSLTPAAGSSVALSNAPLTRNGLTVQPLRLDVAPVGGGLDGATGGARVIVRLSGLTPSIQLSILSGFDTNLFLDGASSSSCGGGKLELVLPNGQHVMPGFVYPLGLDAPTTLAEQQAPPVQTVGPSGSVDLEALFYVPVSAGTGLGLYVDHVNALVAGAARSTPVSGPWEFRLQPSA